jgi:hypothetical protein
MNGRPVPARGGVAGKTLVSHCQKYIPDGEYRRRNLACYGPSLKDDAGKGFCSWQPSQSAFWSVS